MRRIFVLILFCSCSTLLSAQELFVFSEPASNMPSRSMSAKVTAAFPDSRYDNLFRQRYMPEVMFGISKQLMLHAAATFSDYYTTRVQWESARVYAKWRIYSNDDIHRHFRMAAFAEGAYSESPFLYGDLNLYGDNSGVQAGLVATQLVNKLAVSATGGVIKVFGANDQNNLHDKRMTQAFSYSLSTGYLLLPFNYTDYRQTNVNLYMEAIGMRGIGKNEYMFDLAPAIQVIFNSNFKVNIGHRYQVAGNMLRIGQRAWYIGIERTFLQALPKNKKH